VNAICATGQQAGKIVLPQVQRKFSQIIAVQSENIEGVELDLVIVLPAVEPIEVGDLVNAKENSLAIEDELLGSDPVRSLNDQGIAVGPVITVTSEQPDAIAIALYD